MRVLFLTLYPEGAASPRYRVHQFLPYLRDAGVEGTVAAPFDDCAWARLRGPGVRPARYHLHEWRTRIGQLMRCGDYDLVFVQKALASAYLRGLPLLLQRYARRVVYDLDDAVHLAPPAPLHGAARLLEDRQQIAKIARRARLVLVGNAWLAEEMRGLGAAHVEHLPTVVDTQRFVPAAVPADTLRLVWIGGPSTTPALAPAAEALRDMRDCSVELIGADAARVDWPGARITPWHLESEVAALQRGSVGILPLPMDQWSRGKCALKALQYMACGLPCIATPYGAVCDFLRDGENGLFARTPEEWRAAIARLRDPAERARLGAAARQTVEAAYSLERAAPRLLALLREAAK